MPAKLTNRRQLLRNSVYLASGAAFGSLTASAQMPLPEPLKDDHLTLVTTTESIPWKTGEVFKPTFAWNMLNLNIDPSRTSGQAMQGFGACFNELGWTALAALSEHDRDTVMRELFDPIEGARFTYCRMPIGANDFSTGPYSYDETDGDFDLKSFTIDHDKQTLVPFIKAAKQHQPKLRVWASPWTPPSWMKRNHFYAESAGIPGFSKDNGIRPDQIGHEGEDMFIQEPRYFDAYARYFGKFIDAYAAEGIPIGMVMPQNEFNSAQNFPSCTWTPEGLIKFLHALAPEMQKRNVDIFFGTDERGDPKLVETVMSDNGVAATVKGLGMQWAGKNALPKVAREYPQLMIFQSEQECGDGRNEWSYTGYCWQLMKHYFRSGANGYMYWNIALDKSAESHWGWKQNALVTVDTAAKTYRYNHDYYLLKHLTHFVEPGARRADASGTGDDALAFVNPDGKTIVLLRNELSYPQLVQLQAGKVTFCVELPPDSISTATIKLS